MQPLPQRHPSTAYRTIGEDGGLVVLPSRGEVKVINPVAATIFGMLDGTRTVDQIVEAVSVEYEAPQEQIRADAVAFLEELESHGMLLEGDPAEETHA